MEFREFKGKTVHEAITEALIELEITSDMIEYEVIEEGSAGLLGLFSKNAVIRARRKEDVGADEDLFDIKAEIRSGSSLLDGGEKPKAEKKAAKPAQKEKETEADKAVKQNLKASKKGPAQAQNAPVSRAANAPAAAKTPNKGADIAAVRENALTEEKPAKPLAPAKDVDEKPLRDVLNAIFAK